MRWQGCAGPWGSRARAITPGAAGDNPQRLHTEAAFAHLCGVAPIDASSGLTSRHRLNRGGDRSADQALWRIVMVAWSLNRAPAPTSRAGPPRAAPNARSSVRSSAMSRPSSTAASHAPLHPLDRR